MCVYVCVCVRACVRACVRVCVCVGGGGGSVFVTLVVGQASSCYVSDFVCLTSYRIRHIFVFGAP